MPLDDTFEHRRLVEAAVREIQQAATPVILVGGYEILHGAKQELDELLSQVGFPVLAAASGLGIVDASIPHFSGLYVGSCSSPHVLELMQTVDLVISIGNIQSDLSTPGFSGAVDHRKLIEIERTRATVKGSTFEGVHANSVLSALSARFGRVSSPSKISTTKNTACFDISHQRESLTRENEEQPSTAQSTKSGFVHLLLSCFQSYATFLKGLWTQTTHVCKNVTKRQHPITHDWFWTNLEKWLKKGDIIITETGTSSFGIWNTTLPPDSTLIAQYLWSSIGYTIGACQGAALAARDSDKGHRRTILFVGDGSFHCGCQELSTIIRNDLKPIM